MILSSLEVIGLIEFENLRWLSSLETFSKLSSLENFQNLSSLGIFQNYRVWKLKKLSSLKTEKSCRVWKLNKLSSLKHKRLSSLKHKSCRVWIILVMLSSLKTYWLSSLKELSCYNFFSKPCTSFQELTLFHGFSLRDRSFIMEPSRMGSSLSTFMKRNAAKIFQNSRVINI